MRDEAANKSEYSVLQHYEYEYREAKHERPYIIFQRALNTELTVLAFPVSNKSEGYVMMLAHSESDPKIKIVDKADFLVTRDAYTAIKQEVTLSKEVDQFIAARVR